MNPGIESLYRIAKKPKKQILGLMSGTSLDGLDLALCEFEGSGLSTKFVLKQFVSLPYSTAFKESIQAVFAKEQVHFPSLSTLNAEIGIKHAELILSALQSWGIKPEEIDTYDDYITQRVKLAQLSFTYLEHQKKMVEVKDIIIKTRKVLKELDEEFPDYQNSYYDKYMQARKDAGLKESKMDADANFIKFLVEDADLGF